MIRILKFFIIGFLGCIDALYADNAKDALEQQEAVEEMLQLKTQVLARELQRQYRYLEATVNRFNVQVQKAVAKVESGDGANYADSSNSNTSNIEKFDENAIIECKGSISDKISCYYNNLSIIHNSLNGAKTTSKVQKALIKQCTAIKSLTNFTGNTCDTLCKDKKTLSECYTALDNALANYEDIRNLKEDQKTIKLVQEK